MNIASLLLPKSMVAFLYDDFSLRQGLEKMKYHGYSSIPVISRDNRYVGTVSEGDFLWYLVDGIKGAEKTYDIRDTETIRLSDVLRIDKNPPVRIDTKPDALIERACQQNFIPVVDDRECFIGIVTRKAIIESLSVKKEDAGSTTISYGYAPARK
ncbi:MAG: CBS domain-containing protein [Clostridiales bacterium]|nr:MAG: CBS domain-containing protein [Clostridiales bacterium]